MAGKFENKKVQVRKATKQPQKKKSKFRCFKRFVRRASKDNRYRALFCAVILIITGAIGRAYQSRKDKIYYTSLVVSEKANLIEEYESQLASQQESYELELNNLRDKYENPTQQEIMEEEAKYIAKVLYGVCPNHNSGSQRAVVWCVLNRRDAKTFPNTIKEVCEQSSQWISYSDENPVLDKLYNIALEELEKYYTGNRACDENFVYMDWSSKIIYLKNEFNTTKTTKYWTYD